MKWLLTTPETEFSSWSPLSIGSYLPNVSLPTPEPASAIHGDGWSVLPLTDNPPTPSADRYISTRYIRADPDKAVAIYQTKAKTAEMIAAEAEAARLASFVPVPMLRQRIEKLGMWESFAGYIMQYPPLMLKILSLEGGVDPAYPEFSAAFDEMQVPQIYRDYILAPPSAGVGDPPPLG